MTIQLKRNDTKDTISYTMTYADGTPVNLTGATVRFFMGNGKSLISDSAAVVKSANAGQVEYTLTDADTLIAGTFKAEFQVTFSDGKVKTFPTNGYIMVNIQPNMDVNQSTYIEDQIANRVSDLQVWKGEIQSQLDQFAKGDSAPEVAQARVEKDGTTNTTLKARLDKKESEFSQKLDEHTSLLAQTTEEISNLNSNKVSTSSLDALSERLDEIITHNGDGTKDTELIDARIEVNGNTAPSLKSRLDKKDYMNMLNADSVEGTQQSISFKQNGMVDKIQHKNIVGETIREDIFTEHGTSLIIEERKLNNSKRLTFVYRIDEVFTDVLSSEVELYKNELPYTPLTWSEWSGKGTSFVSNDYLVIDNNAATINLEVPITVKPSTKYGILFNVRGNTRTSNAILHVGSGGGYPFPNTVTVNPGVTGAIKNIQTTNPEFTINSSYRAAITSDAGMIEFGEFRIVELPAGSKIEKDFESLPANILNKIYSWEVL